MTKIKPINAPTSEQIFDNLSNSPYYSIAWKYMEKKEINDPTIGDLLIAYHEISKIDHKINKKEK
jgi:hypothetical protein